MIGAVRSKRLTAATLATAAVVLGVSVLVGTGRAQPMRSVPYTCSAADRQFISTVSSNLMQLGYWSDALVSHDVAPGVVVAQTRSEAQQVRQTRPEDRTLGATRDLLASMFLEYSKAVAITARGRSADAHMTTAWRLAGSVHTLLVGAKDALGGRGCDVTPLLGS